MKTNIILTILAIMSVILGMGIAVRCDSNNATLSYSRETTSSVEGLKTNTQLIKLDKIAEYVLDKRHYEDSGRLHDYGLKFDANAPLRYEDMMSQLKNKYDGGGDITMINLFGYDNAQVFIYILQHYDEWLEMKK